ncbi:glycerophosphodiester phosphodiesterase [Paenibacillus sp. LMG 31456]|uniref:Glycerophosphodiester phosphodiesterase n=1 Tax=Paenibacillus foliorum TaxID=2654974 RepID=A0A972GNW3_9BACL|nr:glycerophosphodiester phosphodiesterase family protein [Paenibacillus foliorum]NOU94122.1 glycerophosphodiester phosphodiesterase [Paenibacillus foliorum]
MVHKDKRPLIIGHRGASGEAPENTLASFGLALQQGAEGLELDIHLSADGEIFVCHDSTVDRTTNGTGEIANMSVEELKMLDAGSWFDERYAGEQLPLLEEVFASVPAEIVINVEVKCPLTPRLQERLLQLLNQYDRLQSVVFSSFHHKVLLGLKQEEPRLQVGLLYRGNFINHRNVAELTGMDIYSLHPYYTLIDAEDVADAVSHGLRVYTFTVNDPVQMKRVYDLGVSGIGTDFPALLKIMLDSLESQDKAAV